MPLLNLGGLGKLKRPAIAGIFGVNTQNRTENKTESVVGKSGVPDER
jgi:hypothetical protein